MYAEDTNYFQTTVSPAISQGEITDLLDKFGASTVMIMAGTSNGKYAIVVRFEWQKRTYRFVFTPYPCKNPDKVITVGGKKRPVQEQARYQMGRIAAAFVKAILTAAETMPAALFGFLELPGVSDNTEFPVTAAQMDIRSFVAALPMPRLQEENSDVVNGEVREME